MIDAWLSSSEHTSTPAAAERREHAEVRRRSRWGTARARGIAFHSASSRSSSAWTGRDPTMRRAEPAPAPQRSSASCAAAITAGCAVRPR